jgi:hypothetical protein
MHRMLRAMLVGISIQWNAAGVRHTASLVSDHSTLATLQAIELYTEALKHRDGLPRALLALAKLHLAAGDTAACQAQCVALLKADADNQEAAIMLAQIMFHQVRPQTWCWAAGSWLISRLVPVQPGLSDFVE